jgi:hypothetical protein
MALRIILTSVEVLVGFLLIIFSLESFALLRSGALAVFFIDVGGEFVFVRGGEVEGPHAAGAKPTEESIVIEPTDGCPCPVIVAIVEGLSKIPLSTLLS